MLVLLLLLAAGCRQAEPPAPPWPSAVYPETAWSFGEAVQGERIEHAFVVENRGLEELTIDEVTASERLTVESYDEVVPPGGRGEIRIALDSSGLSGTGFLGVVVTTNDPERPTMRLLVEGRLVTLVELRPQNRVYFFEVDRGETPAREIEIVNHQEVPLEILGVAAGQPAFFESNLEVLEPGQRYGLRLTLKPDVPAGALEQTFTLDTDSAVLPSIPVYARATVQERVWAQPRRVAFGSLRREDLGHRVFSERRILVSRRDDGGFEVLECSTDLTFLTVTVEETEPGRSHTVRVRLDEGLAPQGAIRGTLRIRTNDPDFAELLLPISGSIR